MKGLALGVSLAWVALGLGVGCGGGDDSSEPTGPSAVDSGTSDTTISQDAPSSNDVSVADVTSGKDVASGGDAPVAPPDTSTPDASTPDASTPDGATPDSATPDSAAPDSAAPDSAAPDADADAPSSCPPGFAGANCTQCVRYVTPTGSDADAGADTGKTWATAFATPQAAITAAFAAKPAFAGTCEVWVKAGTYYIYKTGTTGTKNTVTLAYNVPVYGSFAGTETAVAQRSFTTPTSILDGRDSAGGSNRVEHVVSSVGTTSAGALLLDGFVVQYGQSTTTGGGMNNVGSFMTSPLFVSLTVNRCHFLNNSATTGGAINNELTIGTFSDLTVSNNSAVNGGGGMSNSSSTIALSRSTFSANTVTGAGATGGAISNGGATAMGMLTPGLTVTDCTFSANTAPGATATGGAVYSSGVMALTVGGTSNTFEHNEAGNGGGGAIAQVSTATLSVTNALFLANKTTLGGYGGAIRASSGGAGTIAVSIATSRFIQNAATDGGGGGALFLSHATGTTARTVFLSNSGSSDAGAAWVADGSTSRFENDVFAGNVAMGLNSRGGAAFVYAASPRFVNCTIARNYSGGNGTPTGGGIGTGTSGTTELMNTILWKNLPFPATTQGAGTTITSTTSLDTDTDTSFFQSVPTPNPLPSKFETVGTNVYIIQGVDSSPNAAFFTAGTLVGNYLALYSPRTEVLQIVANDTSSMNAFCDGNNMGAFTTPLGYTVDSYRPTVSSSTIVDQGTTAGAPTVDFLGRTRVGGVDIGAYEYLP